MVDRIGKGLAHFIYGIADSEAEPCRYCRQPVEPFAKVRGYGRVFCLGRCAREHFVATAA